MVRLMWCTVLVGTYRGCGVSRMEKDPSTVPFYHVRLPVYSWMLGFVATNMYQFDEHTVWIGTTNRWDKKVHMSLSLFFTALILKILMQWLLWIRGRAWLQRLRCQTGGLKLCCWLCQQSGKST